MKLSRKMTLFGLITVLMLTTVMPVYAAVKDTTTDSVAAMGLIDMVDLVHVTCRDEILKGQETEVQKQKAELKALAELKKQKEEAEKKKAEEKKKEAAKKAAVESEMLYTGADFRAMGVAYYNGYRFTYYSERVLPGNGLSIPGRHADAQGYICDEDEYICVASCNFAKGSVVETPLGKKGKVYDYCPGSGTIDIYVNW